MPKPVQQIVDDAIQNFILQRKTTEEIVADIKRDFSLRDKVFAVADALTASQNAELRAAGKIVERLAVSWTNDTPTDYLRGTNIIVDKPCTCADPRAVDKTCSQYGTPGHEAVVAKRWVDDMLKQGK